MPGPRLIAVLTLAAAACCASVGLVLAQDAGPAAPFPAGPAAAPTGTVVLGGDAPPPEEVAPPPPSGEVDTRAEPVPTPPDPKKAEPMKRPRFTSAILQAVDKTTAETLRFEAKVGEPIRYKGLVVTVHACESAAPDEGAADSMAHLDVQAQPEAVLPQATRVIFRGWMFANSPGLHAVEHPLYDVWLIACKTAAPVVPVAKS